MKHGRLIDADALMEAINTWPKFGVDERGRIVPWSEGYEPYIHLRDVVIAITGMPTIEPEQKRGKWNRYYRMHSRDTFICNRCGSCFVVLQGEDKMNFCPNCGADMRSEGEE